MRHTHFFGKKSRGALMVKNTLREFHPTGWEVKCVLTMSVRELYMPIGAEQAQGRPKTWPSSGFSHHGLGSRVAKGQIQFTTPRLLVSKCSCFCSESAGGCICLED